MNTPRNTDTTLEDVLTQIHECIANDEPLSKELVRDWLKLNGLSYIWLGKQMRCSESTIKNWLCTDKGIPKKREEELRSYILTKTICDQSYDIWKISITPDEDYEERRLARSKEEEGKWVYTLPHMFHEVLRAIADKRFKSVSELISDVLYSYVIWHHSTEQARKEQATKDKKFKTGKAKYETPIDDAIQIAQDQIKKLQKVIKGCERELRAYEEKVNALSSLLGGIGDESLKKQVSDSINAEKNKKKEIKEQHVASMEKWENILEVLQMSKSLPESWGLSD